MTQSAHGGGKDKRLRRSMLLCGLLSAAISLPAMATDVQSEDSVKAAFVLRFAGYVEWPEECVPEKSFSIAVLGASEVATRLQALTADRTIMNRPVQVRRVASMQDVGTAQIVYVGADRRADLRSLLATLRNRCILSISSEDDGLAAGSGINLLLADRRVRFEVSLEAAREARLRISSELLSLAVRVQR